VAPAPCAAYAAGFGSGLFTALLLYLATLPPEGGDRGDAAKPVATAPEQPQPSFDFYEVLPEQTIDVDVDPADLPTERPRSERPAYLLQAGSFRQAEDADRRRAELLLLGLDAARGGNQWQQRPLVPRGHWTLRKPLGHGRARSLTAQQDIDTLLMQRKRG
jgi:cell division protein FtsN